MLTHRSKSHQQTIDNLTASGSPNEKRGLLLAALLMIIIGWAGLAYLVITTRPRIGAEIWLFFILLQIAVTGFRYPAGPLDHTISIPGF